MNKNTLIIVLFVLVGLLGGYIIFSQKNTGRQLSYINGQFNLNGVVDSNTTMSLQQKPASTNSSYVTFAQGLFPKDNSTWAFNEALEGKSYEIQAILYSDGKEIYRSSPIFATAPAKNEVITIEIPAPNGRSAIISGSIGINGYIPVGAKINVEGRMKGEQNYVIVAQGLPAKDEQFLSYATAVAGRTYEIKGTLLDQNGNNIGESDVLTVVAPAQNEELSINSKANAPTTPTPTPTNIPSVTNPPTATPTPTTSKISGTIKFNGAALANSRIVVFQRPTGTTNFQVAIDNISPVDGTSWTWNAPQGGKWYDLVAILKQKQSDGTDKDISDSNTITIAGPAANEQFTINSGFTLPAPSGTISVTCGNKNTSNNTWSVSLAFQTMNGAASYWYQIGTTNGGIELANFTQNATNNPTQSFTQTFNDGTNYYARYAYGNVSNLGAYSSQFSPFSSTTQLNCH